MMTLMMIMTMTVTTMVANVQQTSTDPLPRRDRKPCTGPRSVAPLTIVCHNYYHRDCDQCQQHDQRQYKAYHQIHNENNENKKITKSANHLCHDTCPRNRPSNLKANLIVQDLSFVKCISTYNTHISIVQCHSCHM